jgi:thioredoxin reductase
MGAALACRNHVGFTPPACPTAPRTRCAANEEPGSLPRRGGFRQRRGRLRTESAVGAVALATSRPGSFAVGDVRAGLVKRVASTVGEASVVISKVWERLADERS